MVIRKSDNSLLSKSQTGSPQPDIVADWLLSEIETGSPQPDIEADWLLCEIETGSLLLVFQYIFS